MIGVRVFWAVIGILSLALGLVGIPLPLLPTVPFLLLSAFCFAKSSNRLHNWLLSHPKLGPPIHAWAERGVISRKTKITSTLTVGVTFIIALAFKLSLMVLAVHILSLSCVMVFVWSRPEN